MSSHLESQDVMSEVMGVFIIKTWSKATKVGQ